MLLRPNRGDLRIIALHTGRVLIAVGLTMLVPAAFGAVSAEYDEAAGFVIGACVALLPGCLAEWRLATRRPLSWSHGLLIGALSWLLAAFAGAVPLYLSGHYHTFLDAYFDAMSGFATAGLTVINDLDHLAASVNLWRHIMQFLGGQGLVLLVLSFFATGGGSVGMYVGEAREERILPSVAHTARFIWRVALSYLAIGVPALWLTLAHAGLGPGQAAFHAVTLFMAAFDTGGFAPTTASAGLYHSVAVEMVLSVLMVAGALSFAFHYRLWNGRYGEFARDVETRTLTATFLGLFTVAAVGLASSGAQEEFAGLFRRGFFHVLSAHSGTGFATVPGRLFVTDWGTLAPAALVFAMAFGAMAGSTAGGVKLIRLAVATKAVFGEVLAALRPTSAVTVQHYHSGTRQRLRPEVVRSALLILLLYLGLYLLGALVGLFYGYPFDQALFESTSATAAVGLSVGITGPGTETALKAVFILQMWIGRLEFVPVLVLFGFVWSIARGRV